MSSVADILAEMAANAGRAQLQRGALIGDTIARVSQLPLEIHNERASQQLIAEGQARQRAQDQRAAAQDARQTASDLRDQATQAEAAKKAQALRDGIAAGFGDETDPAKFNVGNAAKVVTAAGYPDLVTTISDVHAKLLPKLTQTDPNKDTRDAAGNIVTPAVAKAMTPAEQAQRDETARHNQATEAIGKLTAGREVAAQQETARHNRVSEASANPLGIGGAAGPAAAGGAAPTGAAVLEKVPPSIASQVKALAEGRMQFPAGTALRTTYWQNMLSLVSQYDPSFDSVNYNARAKTRADFTSGPSAKTINALNTVTQHLGVLSDAANGLNNSSVPAYNRLANVVTQATGNPSVTQFEAAKKAVTDELTRAWRGAGGSEADIKSWAGVLDASESPAQLHGAIAQIGQLLEGKLSALESQFKQGMGPSAADLAVVTPQARQTLSTLEQRAGGKPAATQTAAAPISVAAPNGKIYTFKSQADADAFKAKAGIK